MLVKRESHGQKNVLKAKRRQSKSIRLLCYIVSVGEFSTTRTSFFTDFLVLLQGSLLSASQVQSLDSPECGSWIVWILEV